MVKNNLVSTSGLRKNLILIVLFSITINIQGQKADKNSAFETRLNDFRYSLYATMDTINDLNLFFSQPDTMHILYKMIKEFVNENKELTVNYQKKELKKHCGTIINFTDFEKDTNFFEKNVPKSEFVQLNKYYEKLDKTNALWQLMVFNPIYNALMIKSIYLSQNHSVVDISRYAILDKVALPKIKTQEQDKNIWKIWFDHYRSLYEFTYFLNSNKVLLTGVYLRK